MPLRAEYWTGSYFTPNVGDGCTPEKPVGALMVSSEGACAAQYKYADVSIGVTD